MTNDRIFQTEDRLQMMISAVKDYAIFMLDPDGKVISWNPGAERIKGYSAQEIIGRNFSQFYSKEDIDRSHPQNELKIAFQKGKYEEEGWRVKKDGSKFWAHVVINKVTDSNGNFIGYGKVTRDLTERKRAQEKLKEANLLLEQRVKERTEELERALKVRDEFLSIAAHEFKTPLTPLKLQLQLGKKKILEGCQPEDVLKVFDVGLRQVNGLTALVDDLLEISRLQSGWFHLNLAPCKITELVREVQAKYQHQLEAAGMSVDLESEEDLTGSWDSVRLEQVITNLFTNAMKYAPGSQVKIRLFKKDEIVSLVFSDSGPGIPKDKQSSIFESFERVHQDKNITGLGLGLFISKRIIEAHGGAINLESEMGSGTTFTIILPINLKS